MASSFTCLTKNWRFTSQLRDMILQLVGERLVIKREARPAHLKDRGVRIMKLLFGDASTPHLTKQKRNGERRKGRLLLDCEAIFQMFDMGCGSGGDELVHWCWADADHDCGAMQGQRGMHVAGTALRPSSAQV